LEDKQHDQAMRAYQRLENELHINTRLTARPSHWPRYELLWEIEGVNSSQAKTVLEAFNEWLVLKNRRPLLWVCRWCGKLYVKRGDQTKQRYCSAKHRDAYHNWKKSTHPRKHPAPPFNSTSLKSAP